MREPCVTIGLPVYQGDRFLRESMESLLGQTFGDFELVVADNGSTDGTRDVVAELARGDERIRYIRSEVNRGLAWNWNRLVPLARGRYFKWAAADDVHLPRYVELTVGLLEHDPGAVLAHTRTVDIDEEGLQLQEVPVDPKMAATSAPERFAELTRRGWPCVQVFGLMRLDVLRRTGLLGAYPRSDRALLAELGLHGRLEHVDEILFLRREFRGRVTRTFALRDRYPVFTGRPVRGPVLPTWRLLGGFTAALLRSGLPAGQRVRCVSGVVGSAYVARGALRRELQTALRP